MLSRINDPQSTNQLKTQSLAALPIPISSSPNLNQQDVALNSPIKIVFDKPILPGNGHFILSNGKGDTRSISALDGNQVVISNDQTNTLVITPLKDLLPGSQYSVQMEPGALTDTDGNPLAGVTNSNALNFTTGPEDIAPPIPLSTQPSHNAEQVEIMGSINVKFNEPIKAGSGNITITNGRGDTRKIAITDASQVSIAYSSENDTGLLSIKPALKLLNSSTYSVQIDKGAITDLAGNAFAGVSDTTSFNFTTRTNSIDTSAPQLSADDPIVSLSPGLITLNFNEPVYLVSGSIALSDSQGNSRQIAVKDQSQINTAINLVSRIPSASIILSPRSELVAGSQYLINLENSVITDVAGNKFTGGALNALKVTAASPTNKTPDTLEPVVVYITPEDNKINVPVASNIKVHFNENILPTHGHFIISNDQGDLRVISADDKSQVNYFFYPGSLHPELNILIINPAQNLLANSHYFLRMENGAVIALAGANPVQASTFNFKTSADITPPSAISITPTNASEQVPLDSSITALFNEPITAGDGNITIVDTQNKTSIVISAKDLTQVIFNDTEITVNPKQNFAVNHQYSVLVDANAISDYAGNFIPAVSDPNVLTFVTINDKTAPKFIGYTHPDIIRDVLVPINSSITLHFNEVLKLGKGNITLTDNHGDTRIIDINDSDQVRLYYDSVIIQPKQFLHYNDRYSVLIDAGVIIDLAGNAYADLTDSTSIVFDTRAPNPPPKLSGFALQNTLTYGPTDLATPHLVNSNIALRFDTAFKLGVGYVIISDGHNDTRSIDINDASQVSVVNDKNGPREILINPAADLLSNSHYFIQLEAGSVTDLVGTPIAAITDTKTIAFDTAGLVPAPAAMHPVQEINHGGVEGIYDNHDVLQLNFNQPVNWKFGGFRLSEHDLGGNDIVLSADGLSATVELNHASTIVHGDILTLTGISDQWGHTVDVAFTL